MAIEAFASPFNLTGSPVVVLPIGRTDAGLPIGLQLVGSRWTDMELLATAQVLSELVVEEPVYPGVAPGPAGGGGPSG